MPPVSQQRPGERLAEWRRAKRAKRKEATETERLRRERVRNVEEKRRSRELNRTTVPTLDREEYLASNCYFAGDGELDKSIKEFERRTSEIKHNHCFVCKRVSTNLCMSTKNNVCADCKSKKYSEEDLLEEGLLPVWFDDTGTTRYDVPRELGCLRDCEKMLIQILNTHVPAHHMKYGVIGVKGHVCAFPQDVGSVCKILPRLPKECSVVRYMKETKSRVVGDTSTKIFKIRRQKVMAALIWLKKYHLGYKDVIIQESNLNWMGSSDEEELPIEADIEIDDEETEMEDLGPSPDINITPVEECEDNPVYNGVIAEDSPIIASEEDRVIAEAIERTSTDGGIVLNWPSVGEKAVSEMTEVKIFTLAFPWLFPGGVGDFKDRRKSKKLSAHEWARRLMMFEDARFATDKVFCFYAMNYVVRRRNRESGNFFINKFVSRCGTDLESIQEEIANGNSSFISQITYFSKTVRGSDSYWRNKRDEVHVWINHHVEQGNGMPTFFMTKSCADYFWPDIIRLVKERHLIATGEDITISDEKKGRVKLINDYAAVVQEYFQARVVEWLDTVGKDIFEISHYWVRYEFAPSRGQIHAHMLCISRDQSMNKALYMLRRNEKEQAAMLSDWAERKIGLCATHSKQANDHAMSDTNLSSNPVSARYTDVEDKEEDLCNLKEKVQLHQCSGYCLRDSNDDDKKAYCEVNNLPKTPKPFKMKTCRFGAGTERTEKTGDTPGFALSDAPYFVVNGCGFKRLKMKRNHPRVTQVSDAMLASWRGNCDVQVFVYESNPESPHYDEIARVTDYTVGYACKGGAQLKDEKEHIIGLTNLYCEQTEDGNVRSLAQKILNRSACSRFISKPECIVLLLNLDLATCTDGFTMVNLSGNTRIKSKKGGENSSWLSRYSSRSTEEEYLSLHEFFHARQNPETENKTRWVIPHYTGLHAKPVFPVTMEYARFVATAHKHWRDEPRFMKCTWKRDYDQYIKAEASPTIVKLAHHLAAERYISKSLDAQFTHKKPILNENMDPDMEAFLDLVGVNAPDDLHDPSDIILNYGKKYNWLGGNKMRLNTECGKSWLENEVIKHNESDSRGLNLPKWIDQAGKRRDFEICDLTDDQGDVMAYILNGVKRWLEGDPTFEGIRMIVHGKGGTGKTVLLKTITSVIRRMFQSHSAVVVSGPTGACSCHSGGKTDHSTFALNPGNVNQMDVSVAVKKRLIPEFIDTIVFLFDERSMRESRVIGRMELVARHCAHGGNKTQAHWGGVPIVIQLGDDHQLPSFGKGVSFIPIPGCRLFLPPPESNKMIRRGHQVHLDFSRSVMELPVIKRQDASAHAMRDRLERARHDQLTAADVNFFRGLTVGEGVTQELVDNRANKLYVFAKRERRDEHNLTCLSETSESLGHPVALFRATYTGGPKRLGKPVKKHFTQAGSTQQTPGRTKFCVGCKVSICGRNFMPQWGLYNSAMGTAVEIHFSQKEGSDELPNPNHGDFCDYVVVDFPGYKGPAWDPAHPRQVPIPVISERCQHGCCTKKYVPLELAFATTIHKVEGLTIGPNKEGSEANSAECMIVDVGGKQFEALCPGTFYVSYSRGSTDGDGDPTKSAIIFMKNTIDEHRLLGMTRTVAGRGKEKNLRVVRRDNWIQWLTENTHKSGLSASTKEELFLWASTVKINKEELAKHIAKSGHVSCVD